MYRRLSMRTKKLCQEAVVASQLSPGTLKVNH